MLKTAHIDDSGSDRSNEWYVLAGYVSDVDRWALLADGWQRALDGNGNDPKLKYFKLKEAMRRKDQFYGWELTRRDAKVREFAELVRSNVELQAAFYMSKVDYWKYVKGHIEGDRDSPYFPLLLNAVLGLLSREFKQRGNEAAPIEFVFDEQLDLEEVAHKVRREMVAFGPSVFPFMHMFGGLSFRSDLAVLPPWQW